MNVNLEANVGWNVVSDVKLEVSEDRVMVEIDGIRGEVVLGQAREVRERLARAAVEIIQNTTRARQAELRRFESRGSQNVGQLGECRGAQ